MTLFIPYCIVSYDTVERLCPECGYKDSVDDLPKNAKLALVDTTHFVMAQTELRLLRKTKALFARFPDSRHPVVVGKMHMDVEPQADPGFDAELKADPELNRFLDPDHGFYLPARLRVCERAAESEPPERSQRADIACPECGHFLILPEQFFRMVGLRERPAESEGREEHGEPCDAPKSWSRVD